MIVNVGFGNCINSEKLLAVLRTDAAPVKRMIQFYKEKGRLLDATAGRKTKSLLCLENDVFVLSALQPDTLSKRMNVNRMSNDILLDDEMEIEQGDRHA